MRKIVIIFSVIAATMLAGIGMVGAEGGVKHYLNIGVNPVAPRLFNLKTEDLYSLSQDTLMEIGQKGGKRVRGYARAGIKVVTPKGDTKIIRIYECGNPVFNEIYVAVGKSPMVTVIEKDEEKNRDDVDLSDLSLPPATQERIERIERIERESKPPIEKSGGGGDVILKITNCASSMAIGWGLQSSPKRDENFAIGGSGTAGLVISYTIDRKVTWGDVLTTAVCGAIGALVAPAQPSSGYITSNSPPPPSGGSGGPITPPSVPLPSGGSTSGGSGEPVTPPPIP